MIARGKRLGTRATALALLSGVIVGVTGAAGQDTTVASQRVAVQSAYVAPRATALPVSETRIIVPTVGTPHPTGDGPIRPTTPLPVVGGHLPTVPVPVTHDPGKGDNGNGNGNGQGQGQGQGGPTGDPGQGHPTGDPGQGGNGNGNGNGNGQGGPTGDPGQGHPTGDPGQGHPTGDPGKGGNGNGGPTGDPGQGHPTGDPGGHHPGDGQGPGNSGQSNPPTPAPTPAPVPSGPSNPSGGTISHTPAQTPPTTTTPSTTPTPTPIGSKKPQPKTKTGGKGFNVSGLVPVKTSKRHSSHPLLSAAGSGLSLPVRTVAADLARVVGVSGAAGNPSGAAGSGSALTPSQRAAAAAAAQKAAARAAEAKQRAAAAAAKSNSMPQEAARVFTTVVKSIPSSIWIALAASLGLALMGATAAVAAGRRAHRQARRVAEVSAVALTDSLTGVLNRRGFIEAAERELDRAVRHGRAFALSYIDVRGLKGVNDGEGHMAGDQLLRAATAVLTESVRAHDVVGRLGGDEFGLLLAEQTAEEAAQVTERIADQVTATRAELAFSAHWDLTVGTASFPEDGSTVEELLDTADRRLYEKRGIELATAR